jgi:septum formation protein
MSFWGAEKPLVLASRSAARRALLEAARIPCEIHPADLDERALERSAGSVTPAALAAMLADAKAKAVAQAMPGRLVLGADQTLGFGARIFSKPADHNAARTQLELLRGATHELHAAIVLARDGETVFSHVAVARLSMRRFSDEFLDGYLDAAGAAACASVGGYQLEGLGVHLFERIEGDYFTILGLPLLPLLEFLRSDGDVAA